MSHQPSKHRADLPRRPTRRRLLLGGGAVVLLGAGAVAVEPRLRQGTEGVEAVVPPAVRPALPKRRGVPVVTGTFDSSARRTPTGWSIAYPPGFGDGDVLPFLLVLHGRSDDHRAALGSHGLGDFLTQVVKRGSPPFALVAVDGGDHDYWHPRVSGTDAQAMLIDELLPLVASHGLRVDRFAVGGWSMGGYGALLLAEKLGPARIAAVAVDSPAVWTRAGETAPGAFDSADDFRRHDVLRQSAVLRRIPLRVTCGTADPFLPGVRALLAAVPQAQADLGRGGHDVDWWRHAAPGQLAFVGQHLHAT